MEMTVKKNGTKTIMTTDVRTIFKKNKGYSTLRELKEKNIHTSVIKNLLTEEIIEKIKPGLYKLKDYPFDNQSEFIDICRANPAGVICEISALSYYELTTQHAFQIDIAIPNSRKPVKIFHPPVKYHFYREATYALGIDKINTKNGSIRIYNREKTICDIFRSRRHYGEEVILEALKEYLKIKSRDINKLYEYAKLCRVEKIIFQYVKILAG